MNSGVRLYLVLDHRKARAQISSFQVHRIRFQSPDVGCHLNQLAEGSTLDPLTVPGAVYLPEPLPLCIPHWC